MGAALLCADIRLDLGHASLAAYTLYTDGPIMVYRRSTINTHALSHADASIGILTTQKSLISEEREYFHESSLSGKKH